MLTLGLILSESSEFLVELDHKMVCSYPSPTSNSPISTRVFYANSQGDLTIYKNAYFETRFRIVYKQSPCKR